MKYRKKRSLLQKEWKNLRSEIAQISSSKLNIEKTDFRPLTINENWKKIEKSNCRNHIE